MFLYIAFFFSSFRQKEKAVFCSDTNDNFFTFWFQMMDFQDCKTAIFPIFNLRSDLSRMEYGTLLMWIIIPTDSCALLHLTFAADNFSRHRLCLKNSTLAVVAVDCFIGMMKTFFCETRKMFVFLCNWICWFLLYPFKRSQSCSYSGEERDNSLYSFSKGKS